MLQTKGQSHPNIKILLRAVEIEAEAAPYTRIEVPLSWIKLLDEMQESTVLSLEEVNQMAAALGIEHKHCSYALEFLHDMGKLLWRGDDLFLRDIVVVDPIAFFVNAITKIICNIEPHTSRNSYEHHRLPEHTKCQKKYLSEWLTLCEEGRLNGCLLPIFWGEVELYRENINKLTSLSVFFELFVPLTSKEYCEEYSKGGAVQTRGSCEQEEAGPCFLVPSLLKLADPNNEYLHGSWSKLDCNSCLFCFTSSKDLQNRIPFAPQDMKKYGFLPNGFFSRLCGKLVSWYEYTQTRLIANQAAVFKDIIIMNYGTQRFRVEQCYDINAIRLDVEGSPKGVMKLLSRIIERIIGEYFYMLKYFIAMSCNGGQPKVEDYDMACKGTNVGNKGRCDQLFVALSAIRGVANKSTAERTVLMIKGTGQKLLDYKKAISFYSAWLPDSGAMTYYDIFISYRWSIYDSAFCMQVYENMELMTWGSKHDAVKTFLDSKRLLTGKRFDDAFADALANSKMAVPIISAEALKRMKSHNPNEVDNCLLEWILMCIYTRVKRIRLIMPVVFGTITKMEPGGSGGYALLDSVTIGNFWDEKHVDALPTVVPKATLEAAKRHLSRSLGVETAAKELSSEQMTVKSVVQTLMKYNTECFGWNYESLYLPRILAEKFVEALATLPVEEEPLHQQPNKGVTSSNNEVTVSPDVKSDQARSVVESHTSLEQPHGPREVSDSTRLWTFLHVSDNFDDHSALLDKLKEVRSHRTEVYFPYFPFLFFWIL